MTVDGDELSFWTKQKTVQPESAAENNGTARKEGKFMRCLHLPKFHFAPPKISHKTEERFCFPTMWLLWKKKLHRVPLYGTEHRFRFPMMFWLENFGYFPTPPQDKISHSVAPSHPPWNGFTNIQTFTGQELQSWGCAPEVIQSDFFQHHSFFSGQRAAETAPPCLNLASTVFETHLGGLKKNPW